MALAQVSGQSKSFFRSTLVYKRLTELIFDPVGLGDGRGSWKLVTLLGA